MKILRELFPDCRRVEFIAAQVLLHQRFRLPGVPRAQGFQNLLVVLHDFQLFDENEIEADSHDVPVNFIVADRHGIIRIR